MALSSQPEIKSVAIAVKRTLRSPVSVYYKELGEGGGWGQLQGECPIKAMAKRNTAFANLPPLWVSCMQGNLSWVFASLARGGNPNASSPGGVPGLMYASSRGHNDILEVFSDYFFKENFIIIKDNEIVRYDLNYFQKAQIKPIKEHFFFNFKSPLKDDSGVQVLLQHNLVDIASPDTSKVGGTCLHWACYGDNEEGLSRSERWPFELR